MLKRSLLFLAAGVALAGCQDKISTLGAQFYPDTVENRTSVRSDASFIQFADTLRPFVNANGVDYNLTARSPLMIIGKVALGNENLESWGLLQFPSLTDSVKNIVIGVRLLLKDVNYKYGDTTNSRVAFQVHECFGKVTDSTTSLSISDLQQPAIGTIDSTNFPDLADSVLLIALDPSVIPNLKASSLGFVVTPGPAMTNCRGFGTTDNSDTNSVPKLELTLKTGSGNVIIYETPSIDLHLVKDMTVVPANEFTLRGGAGARERITLNLTRPGDTAQLNSFSTINNATLVLHLDLANSRRSNQSFDSGSTGPSVVQLATTDSGATLDAFGYRDPADPTNTTYRFQVRGMVEYWLRNPSLNFGFELRSGFVRRAIGTESIGVEDNTLNRWTFYGPNCPDSTKRPQFILSYSKLH